MMKKFLILIVCLCLAALCACGAETTYETASGSFTAEITLSGSSGSVRGSGAAVSGGELVITQGGLYRLTGSFDGSVTVDCDDAVELVLDGVQICGDGWALYARSCEALTLTLCGENALSQTTTADENGVCLESKAAVTVCGDGSMSISAAGIGLRCADELVLKSGSVTVSAGDLGVKAKGDGVITVTGGSLTVTSGAQALRGDAVTIAGGSVALSAGDHGVDADMFVLSGGTLCVTAASDAIHADTSLTVSGGTLTADAGCDGLQAGSELVVTGGTLDVLCAGGAGQAINRVDAGATGGGGMGMNWGASGETTTTYTMPDYSCKALKSDGTITVTGGTLTLNSADDAIHAAGNIELSGAELTICTNDDAVHSDSDLTIHSGTIYISDCFEGLEAAVITINGGDLDIYSVNDGINASTGSGEGFAFGGDGAAFVMNGGEVDIFVTGTTSNLGDGVDSNGSITINGGRITSSTDGATQENGIDSGSSFVVTGGILVACGNSGMQETPSTSSTQCTAVLNLSAGVDAGTEISITDEQGSVVLTYTPYRWANCIVVSHPDFVIGGTYTLTAGSQTKTFTFSSVTYSESGFGGMGGMGGGMGGMGGGRMF